jgi:hypothetical protein
MPKSFSGPDLLKALSEGGLRDLREAIIKEGIVKQDENDPNAILYSESLSSTSWMSIPVEMIEKAEYIKNVHCNGHEHPFVRLHFKEPAQDNKEASVFADLLRRSSQPGATDDGERQRDAPRSVGYDQTMAGDKPER